MSGLALNIQLRHPRHPVHAGSTEAVQVTIIPAGPTGTISHEAAQRRLASAAVEVAFARREWAGLALAKPRRWHAADWGPGRQYAGCLTGPDTPAELAAGTWDVWVRVSAPPERVVRHAGTIQVE